MEEAVQTAQWNTQHKCCELTLIWLRSPQVRWTCIGSFLSTFTSNPSLTLLHDEVQEKQAWMCRVLLSCFPRLVHSTESSRSSVCPDLGNLVRMNGVFESLPVKKSGRECAHSILIQWKCRIKFGFLIYLQSHLFVNSTFLFMVHLAIVTKEVS